MEECKWSDFPAFSVPTIQWIVGFLPQIVTRGGPNSRHGIVYARFVASFLSMIDASFAMGEFPTAEAPPFDGQQWIARMAKLPDTRFVTAGMLGIFN